MKNKKFSEQFWARKQGLRGQIWSSEGQDICIFWVNFDLKLMSRAKKFVFDEWKFWWWELNWVLTVELTAHHGDLQRLEVALHKGLTIVTGVSPRAIEEKHLGLCSVPGQDGRLDVDQEAHEVLLVRWLGKSHDAAVLIPDQRWGFSSLQKRLRTLHPVNLTRFRWRRG